MPNHHSVDAAISWVDAAAHSLDTEEAPLSTARGRALTEHISAVRPIPSCDCAALDGFAVQASASFRGERLQSYSAPLDRTGCRRRFAGGNRRHSPLELAEPDEQAYIEIVEAVAAGHNVERQGAVATIGATLVPAGTLLAARHIGLLTIAGLPGVPVVHRPRVRILVAKPARMGAWEDSNGSMIRAAVERDGGVVGERIAMERDLMAIRSALVEAGVDVVLVIGGTGPGIDDHSAAALVEAGELAIHGVALRPGETAGLGRIVGGVPVVLLPGAPAACLWSYELFAGRAIRRLGGRGPELPYRSREMITARKIVSAIGMTEICPVRCGAGDSVEPLPSFAETGLMAAVGADGFVIVPEGSEGHPQRGRVTVYLYEGC